MTSRSYSGGPLDYSWQYISERPELDRKSEDIVYATKPEPAGEERAENVLLPEPKDESNSDHAYEHESELERPDVAGQTTLADWGGGDGACRRRG